jgi:tetratricopeptide (TPR) repeat protein
MLSVDIALTSAHDRDTGNRETVMPASDHPPRTELERLIRERRRTLEEFSKDADRFAIEHALRATLSPRHLQRLASGQREDGRPLGPVRPATRRLLERMLGRPIEELLASPREVRRREPTDTAAELRARLAASRAVDNQLVRVFQEQTDLARTIDRKLGGVGLLAELRERIAQMQRFLCHALNPDTRTGLANVLVDSCTLAGWLALDSGTVIEAWGLYDQARTAARESGSSALEAYACAGQSTVLLDIGEHTAAVELTEYARTVAHSTAPRLLLSWLAGAHGEACAASGQHTQSLRAFDEAARLISDGTNPEEVPFLVFDGVHLARWRGNALARLGDREAVDVLSRALQQLDPSFTRAEAAMRVDLARALHVAGELDAATMHADRALGLALQIGSVRQRTRLSRIAADRP